MRVLIAGLLLFPLMIPGESHASSITTDCPEYVTRMERAREALTRGDRAVAVGALVEARAALEECVRRGAGEAGGPVMLAASPARSAEAQYGCSAWRRMRSTSAGSTGRPASS